MAVVFKYRARIVTDEDLTFIRNLIEQHPTASRRRLSALLCEAFNWVQPNGTLCDMVCRSLMLGMHRAGMIQLPPVRQVNPNPLAVRAKPKPVTVEDTELCRRLRQIQPLRFVKVRRTKAEAIFNGVMEQYHYLGYTQPVGEHLKYLVYSEDRPIAALAWSSAPRHLGPRDRFIGWSSPQRRQNIRFIAYNSRFLIFPWVHVPHLASHILGVMARMLSRDWEHLYGHPVYFLETFIDPQRFKGTCYRAANWIALGRTTGRGHQDQTHRPNRPLKEILAYPLTQQFRQLLCQA
ncbi:MAG: DUF4338 domain-containing protein [Planctomycetes bacterium]|nr:DUF4338 domain-containing protein [Planctomycetota bacterium]